MSAPLPRGLLISVTRAQEIEAFMKAHPEKVTKVPPVQTDTVPQVAEQFDRDQIGQVWGAYRRRKHGGAP